MPVHLETENCLLAPITDDDRENIFSLYTNAQTRAFLGGPVLDKDMLNKQFDEIQSCTDRLNWSIHLKKDDRFVGMINVHPHHDEAEQEISYQLSPDHWGKGFAQETVNCVLSYMAGTKKLRRILAETQKANIASCKLLEKLGMIPLKTITRFGETQIIYKKDLC